MLAQMSGNVHVLLKRAFVELRMAFPQIKIVCIVFILV